jgi:predicted exporter
MKNFYSKKPKFLNKKTVVDGITFDSKKEAEYYGVLKLRKMAGEIKDFKIQVPFEMRVNGELICKYIADFVVYYPNGIQVIDVKSEITRTNPVYRIKIKLLKAIHGITIVEK